MTATTLEELLKNIDIAFWEDRLEIGVEQAVEKVKSDDHLYAWIKKLSKRQRRIVAEALGLEGELFFVTLHRAVLGRRAAIVPFWLVDESGKKKRKSAILEVARAKLPEAVVASCLVSGGQSPRYDSGALMYRLFMADPHNLELVFHLDRTHRKGFAPMVLAEPPAGDCAAEDATTFLTPERLQPILDEFEQSYLTMRKSHCAAVLPGGSWRLVFVKRDYQPGFISSGVKNIFGYEREWIILDFEDGLERVGVSAASPDDARRIASRIASRYFGQRVQYQNVAVKTPEEDVQRLLGLLVAEPDKLPLMGLSMRRSGLAGSPAFRLSDPLDETLTNAIIQLSRAFGDPFRSVSLVHSVDVFVFGKLVKIIFEPVAFDRKSYVVRYTDRTLSVPERREFEARMRRDYGLVVISTEKRHAA